MILHDLDYFELLKEAKKESVIILSKKVKVALLADCSTQHLVPLLKVFLNRNQLELEVFEAEFDTIDMQVYDPKSRLYSFEADFIVLLNTTQALRGQYDKFIGDSGVFAESLVEKYRGYWDLLRQRCPKAVILHSNFVPPCERVQGNLDARRQDSFLASVRRLNQALSVSADTQGGVLINDLAYVAAYQGTSRWFDEKMWLLYKLPCALELLPYAAKNITDIVLASLGRTIKCVILDLDNTLWGGVIGEDGLDGIAMGHTQEGEAYTAFQSYLLRLQRGGVLLAVCSKNDADNARLPFQKHPEMVLKEEDFAVFLANWENKADNIKTIQSILNIGFDQMLFLDDMPFERELVRQHLPGVIVPELPADPSSYIRYLSEINSFETTLVSELDRERTAMIRTETVRKDAAKQFTDITEYLKSLEMKLTLAPFDTFHISRIAQLIQRSNQFNLTTKRYPQTECEGWMNRPQTMPVYLKLADRFGDMGLISVIMLVLDGDTLRIDSWLMSCRVLLRGVEQYAMNFVFEYAKKCGAAKVVGEYIPTDKNQMVKNFYHQFGFIKQDETASGATRWVLAVADYQPQPVMIRANGSAVSLL